MTDLEKREKDAADKLHLEVVMLTEDIRKRRQDYLLAYLTLTVTAMGAGAALLAAILSVLHYH